MNRNKMPWLAGIVPIALIGLAVTGCGGGGPAPVNPPPSSAHSAAEQAATMNWLAKTNAMWTSSDFAGLDQVTTAALPGRLACDSSDR
jgi:hypothetical protein